MQKTAYVIRFIHLIVSLYFLGCLLILYHSILINKESKLLYIAIISLLIEGLIIFFNRNTCPLGFLHKQYGDDKAFFELFMPKKLAQNVIPIMAVFSIAGIVIFFIEALFKLSYLAPM
jgi:hypothetical protein